MLNLSNSSKLLWYPVLILVILSSFFLGAWFSKIITMAEDEIQICPVLTVNKEKLGVIELTEVSPFGVQGKVNGNNIRLFNGENILEIKPDENFQLNTAKIFRNIMAVIPKDAHFFASVKGKKFYPVSNTKQMETIRPENLLFFNTEEEAINKGFVASASNVK